MRTHLLFISQLSSRRHRAQGIALLTLVLATLGGGLLLRAQSQATPATIHKTAHPHKPLAAAHMQSSAPQAPAAQATPAAAPEEPKWPANEKPTPASITWDSQGLRIDATNSSLAQILTDVSTFTGANVEGFDFDQRVFGVFGPGTARDVLSQLLQGSGYNVLLIGDQGQGTPRSIMLSSRHPGTTPAATSTTTPSSDDDNDVEEQPQPQPAAPPIQPAFPPNRMPRTPQQMQQMMQQRQQQGQPQPGQPPVNPPN